MPADRVADLLPDAPDPFAERAREFFGCENRVHTPETGPPCVALTALLSSVASDAARKATAEESTKDARQRHLDYLLWYRGIPEERICPPCGGSGIRCYGSTSTWRGGIGGCAMTNGVCDRCWGTGDTGRPGENLRALWLRLREAERTHRGRCKLADTVIQEQVRAALREGRGA